MADQTPQPEPEQPEGATPGDRAADRAEESVDPGSGSGSSGDDATAAMDAAQDAMSRLSEQTQEGSSVASEPSGGGARVGNTGPRASGDPERFEPPEFALRTGEGEDAVPAETLEMLSDVDLGVTIELGRTSMYVEDVLRLNEGSVVELDKLAGDPVDIFVNNRHVARGEVLVLNDNFCVRVSEILAPVDEQDKQAS